MMYLAVFPVTRSMASFDDFVNTEEREIILQKLEKFVQEGDTKGEEGRIS